MWRLQPEDIVKIGGKYYRVSQVLRSDIPGSIPKVLGEEVSAPAHLRSE